MRQISDLQFLLEMFSRWQLRIFPHGKFDDFIMAIEKMSAKSIVKVGWNLDSAVCGNCGITTLYLTAVAMPAREKDDAAQPRGRPS